MIETQIKFDGSLRPGREQTIEEEELEDCYREESYFSHLKGNRAFNEDNAEGGLVNDIEELKDLLMIKNEEVLYIQNQVNVIITLNTTYI